MGKSRRKGVTQNSGKQSCSRKTIKRKRRARQQTDIRRIPSAGTESNGRDSKTFAASPSRSGYTTRHIRRYSQSRKDGAQESERISGATGRPCRESRTHDPPAPQNCG